MFCNRCGARLSDGAVVCQACGTTTIAPDNTPAAAQTPVQAAAATPVQAHTPAAYQALAVSPPAGKPLSLVLIITAIILNIPCGLTALCFRSRANKAADDAVYANSNRKKAVTFIVLSFVFGAFSLLLGLLT